MRWQPDPDRHAAPVDATAWVEAPEHITFDFELAGPWQRGLAYFADIWIRCLGLGFLLVAAIVLMGSGAGLADVAEGLLLLGWFVTEWLYHVLFEWLWNGQTPGKRWFGLRVIRTGGTPIGAYDAVLRNLLRAADWWPPPWYLVGLFVSASDPRFRRIGDLVADTMVVVERPRIRPQPIRPLQVPAALVDSLPARLQLSPQERKWVQSLVQRAPQLGMARLGEIAQPMADIWVQRWHLAAQTSPAQLVGAVHQRMVADRTEAGTP